MRHRLVQGDTAPTYIVSLTNQATGRPIDVSAATVRMRFRAEGSATVIETLVGSKLAGKRRLNGTVDASDATPGKGGRVEFAWSPSTLAGAPGYYEGEIEITFAGGLIQTVDELQKFSIRADFG